MKNLIGCSILLSIIVHTALLYYDEIRWPVACWGILMQGVYLKFLHDFPHVNINSILFYSTTGICRIIVVLIL